MFYAFMHVKLNIFALCIVFISLYFVVCMTVVHEGYEDNEFYENFQDQTFEAEDRQLPND
jgi:hypothetical protein